MTFLGDITDSGFQTFVDPNPQINGVPEPGSFAVFGLGLLGLAGFGLSMRRRGDAA